MTSNIIKIQDLALPLPITQTARQIAQRFASLQPKPQKAKQVRLNTLAVCVVNDYLQMMGIPTDISKSDSWNPVVRLGADVADLEVTGLGRLECRPIKATDQTYHIPPEVRSDRIGYVVVQIDESLREAAVLGFSQTAAIDELPISQLRPPEDLLEHLSQLMQPVAAAVSIGPSTTRVNLSQWIQNVFDTGWQTVESLLPPPQSSLAFTFRNKLGAVGVLDDQPADARIRRAKVIDLGMQLNHHPVTLCVEITPKSEHKTKILLKVQPINSQHYLPPQLQLIVLDESAATFLEAMARNADNYIQLEFSGNSTEQFSVKVALGDASITEDFVI